MTQNVKLTSLLFIAFSLSITAPSYSAPTENRDASPPNDPQKIEATYIRTAMQEQGENMAKISSLLQRNHLTTDQIRAAALKEIFSELESKDIPERKKLLADKDEIKKIMKRVSEKMLPNSDEASMAMAQEFATQLNLGRFKDSTDIFYPIALSKASPEEKTEAVCDIEKMRQAFFPSVNKDQIKKLAQENLRLYRKSTLPEKIKKAVFAQKLFDDVSAQSKENHLGCAEEEALVANATKVLPIMNKIMPATEETQPASRP